MELNKYLGEDEAEKTCHVLNIMYHSFMTWQGYYDNRHDLSNWGWYIPSKKEFFKKEVSNITKDDGKRILEISLREMHCATNWQSIAEFKQHHVCVLGQYVPEDGPREGEIWAAPRVIDFASGYNCLPVATSDIGDSQCMAIGCTDDEWAIPYDSNSASTNNPYTILPLSDFGSTTQEAKCQGDFERWNSCASTAEPEGDELCNPDDDSGDTISVTMCHERCECEPGYKYNSNATDAVCVDADYCNTDEDDFYIWNRYDALGNWRENTEIAQDLKALKTHKTLSGPHGDGQLSKCWDVKKTENSNGRIGFGEKIWRMPCHQALTGATDSNLDKNLYNQCKGHGFLQPGFKKLQEGPPSRPWLTPQVIINIIFKHQLKIFLLGVTKSPVKTVNNIILINFNTSKYMHLNHQNITVD